MRRLPPTSPRHRLTYPTPRRLSKSPTSARLLRLLRLGRSRTSLKSSLRSASMRGMLQGGEPGAGSSFLRRPRAGRGRGRRAGGRGDPAPGSDETRKPVLAGGRRAPCALKAAGTPSGAPPARLRGRAPPPRLGQGWKGEGEVRRGRDRPVAKKSACVTSLTSPAPSLSALGLQPCSLRCGNWRWGRQGARTPSCQSPRSPIGRRRGVRQPHPREKATP